MNTSGRKKCNPDTFQCHFDVVPLKRDWGWVGDQYLIIKCIFLISLLAIQTKSCYL